MIRELLFLASTGVGASASLAAEPLFTFTDVAEATGLAPGVAKAQAHAAGWGDVDGDGWPDLYVGVFARGDGPANALLRNHRGKFALDTQTAPRLRGRANSALFADFDNDGDLDLYVSSMPLPQRQLVGCKLFRNRGGGEFEDVSADNGACPPAFGGRSAAAADFNGDGLLDLLVGEDPLPGYNGSKTKRARCFRNLGDLRFQDVSDDVGLPAELPGLGVAVGDVNGDGWPDFFAASKDGGNRLFVNTGQGRFAEAEHLRTVFDWSGVSSQPDADDTPCGACLADLNRDGRLDLIVGHHFARPWAAPVRNRLYLNRGEVEGRLSFVDVTEAAGLVPLPMKAPHVEARDFDNDGWPDIYASLVKFADGRAHPLVFKNLGPREGAPRFAERALAVNDFPTAEDRAIVRSGEFFQRMIARKQVLYAAASPTCDFDRDGRIDIFLANWWPESPSLLLRNETPGGNWLAVEAGGAEGVNRQGVGAVVRVFEAGRLGEAAALLGAVEISLAQGYVSNQEAVAHFGLGAAERVDVEIVYPHGRGARRLRDAAANQRLK